jgi:uncharacterized protein
MSNSNKIIVFSAIVLSLAVAVRLAVPVIGEASLLVTMLTPAIAVAIMLLYAAPEGGFRDAIASLGLTTPGLKGWPLAIGGPMLIHLAGIAILVAAGLTTLVAPEVSGSGLRIAFKLVTGLFIGTMLALCEEVGWRGYLLPRMKGFGIIGAMLSVGLLHGIWHLPLLLTTGYYHSAGNPWIVTPLFLLTLTLAGVFFGYLRMWTGSVWPVAIAHAAANTAWEISSAVSQTKSAAALEYIGGESGLIMIGGLLIVDALLIRAIRRNGLRLPSNRGG